MQGDVKILFVCSQNRWRSLTAEKVFEGAEGYEVRSAGTDPGARVRLTPGMIGWADKIFVMEKKHQDIINSKYGDMLVGKELVCLHIPDEYRFMDRELVEILTSSLSAYIPLAD